MFEKSIGTDQNRFWKLKKLAPLIEFESQYFPSKVDLIYGFTASSTEHPKY